MKKLLLVMGDLAAGKSTFATILSRRYGANVFCKDSIKEVLGDTIGFSNREENLNLSKATIELMFFLFQEFGKLGKDLVLESNFHEKELERIHAIAQENNYEVLTIVLRGDTNILHKRYLNRIHNENRHPVHLSTTLDIYEEFERYTERSRKENIPGRTILINADSFSHQKDEEILRSIDEFMR